MRERGFLAVHHHHEAHARGGGGSGHGRASAILHSRVRLLEKDVRAIVRTIEKTRARVSASGYCRPCFADSAAAKPARVGR